MLFACHEEIRHSPEEPKQRTVLVDAFVEEPDYPIVAIPDFTVDAYVDPCDGVQNIDENYCQCHPRCCQEQTWYCPPRGTEVLAKYAILDICGEDHVPCDRNLDDTCPPAEIILETACNHMFDCPPGINEDFTMYYDCEINGNVGRQEVQCDKGRLYYGECVSCISSDEVCDGRDNDCDDNIDEHQLNACGECGPLPQDICDGLDNDCDGQTDEDLIRECQTVCERGVETCIDGAWTSCTARQPIDEACDGFDSDCDALVDEGLNCSCPPEMIGALIPCMEPPLNCGMGFKTCECASDDCSETSMSDCLALCAWLPPEIVPQGQEELCDRFDGLAVNPEVCNNFDEDCDQLVDERIQKMCYTGPEGTVDVGVCTSGTQVCQEGRWLGEASDGSLVLDFCSGETVPSREICDGSDNDCDGITDFGEQIPDTDILFILDWSGSMEFSINAVRMAMNRFASQFAAEESLKWGLITGPRILQQGIDTEYLRIDSNIADFVDFISSFANAGNFEGATSDEMLKDALYLAVSTIAGNLPYDIATASWRNGFNPVGSVPPLQQFRINWRPNTDRIIILFTDENDQTFLSPQLPDESLVAALASSPDTTLYVFAPLHYQRTWRQYVDVTSGSLFSLTNNPEQMYDSLMGILDEICLPDDDQASLAPADYMMPVSNKVHLDFTLRMCF